MRNRKDTMWDSLEMGNAIIQLWLVNMIIYGIGKDNKEI